MAYANLGSLFLVIGALYICCELLPVEIFVLSVNASHWSYLVFHDHFPPIMRMDSANGSFPLFIGKYEWSRAPLSG